MTSFVFFLDQIATLGTVAKCVIFLEFADDKLFHLWPCALSLVNELKWMWTVRGHRCSGLWDFEMPIDGWDREGEVITPDCVHSSCVWRWALRGDQCLHGIHTRKEWMDWDFLNSWWVEQEEGANITEVKGIGQTSSLRFLLSCYTLGAESLKFTLGFRQEYFTEERISLLPTGTSITWVWKYFD